MNVVGGVISTGGRNLIALHAEISPRRAHRQVLI